MAPLLADLVTRGLVHSVTDHAAIEALPAGTPFYFGVDPTAASAHIGNLLGLVVAARLARAGLSPIVLFGGATGLIGDPGGRSNERTLLDATTVASHTETMKRKVREIFARLNVEVTYVNNLDWLRDVSMLDFLRETGKHFSVNVMLARDAVRSRLAGDGISYTEFSYVLLQAVDYAHLFHHYGCRLQIGGSDQWGNITAGIELIRKKFSQESHALCYPLLTDSSGQKLGKSTGGGVWLDESRTPPYVLHQFFLNLDDAKALELLKWFSLRPLDEIAAIQAQHQQDPAARHPHRALADEVCSIVHGDDAAHRASAAGRALFAKDSDLLGEPELEVALAAAPTVSLARGEALALSVVELAATARLVTSKSEARRLIQNGGLYLNGQRVADVNAVVADLVPTSGEPNLTRILLRSGKRNYTVVNLEDA